LRAAHYRGAALLPLQSWGTPHRTAVYARGGHAALQTEQANGRI